MVLHNDGQLIALAGACKLGHVGGREEEQGEGGALVDGRGESKEAGDGGDKEVAGKKKL